VIDCGGSKLGVVQGARNRRDSRLSMPGVVLVTLNSPGFYNFDRKVSENLLLLYCSGRVTSLNRDIRS